MSIEDYFDNSYELEYTHQKVGKDLRLKEVSKITDLAAYFMLDKKSKWLGWCNWMCSKHIDNEFFAVLLEIRLQMDL